VLACYGALEVDSERERILRRRRGGAYRVFSGLECGGGAMLGNLMSRIQLLESDGLYSGQATQRKAWGLRC